MTFNAFPNVGSLLQLISTQKLIVCLGTGGVGKTTTAAAIGLHAACIGKRVLVVTIDPAKRLANALGLDEVRHQDTEISRETFEKFDITCRGSLSAAMLDSSSTFDDLVNRISPDNSIKQKIFGNHVYQSISQTLAATHEYMASEKLFDVYQSGKYDLIVLDTPPMKNALDFLDAPQKVVRFLDERIIKWFMISPPKEEGLFSGKFSLSSGNMTYKLLGYIFGREFIKELSEFFLIFKELTEGFRHRSQFVEQALRAVSTRFLIISGPTRSAISDARHFLTQVRHRGLTEAGFLVNQAHVQFWNSDTDTTLASPETVEKLQQSGMVMDDLLPKLSSYYSWIRERASEEQNAIGELKEYCGNIELFKVVPKLSHELNDLSGLITLNHHLF